MNTANHISSEDLALFALQCLPDSELRDIVGHLEHCELCRNEVGNLQGDLVAYAMTAELHTPPAAARERLLRRVAKEKKLIPAAPAAVLAEPVIAPRSTSVFGGDNLEEMPARSGMGFGGWAGWALAAGVLVAAGLQFHQRQNMQSALDAANAKLAQQASEAARAQLALDALTASNAFQVVMHVPGATKGPAAKPAPEAHTSYDAEKGALVFVATSLEPLPAYKTYELWVLPADGKDPIPAGIFKPDANSNATVVMPELPKGVTAKGFGVTIEDDGGSKSPTMSTLTLVGM